MSDEYEEYFWGKKKVEGETLTGKPKPPEHRKAEKVDKPKRFNYNKKKFSMKKALKWITDTVSGENKVGEVVHGVLDILPVPNQIVAKIFSYLGKGETSEAKQELNKLLTVRNGIALAFAIMVALGVLSVEDLKAILEVFN